MDGKNKQEPAGKPPTSTSTNPGQSNDDTRKEAAGNGSNGSGNGNGNDTKKGADGGKVKRVAACDVCRLRKVKCVKDEGATRCQGCTDLNRDCTFTYTHKRPGPPNPYARPGSYPNEGRYNPYPMPPGNHHQHTRHPYQGQDDRASQAPGPGQGNLPYLPSYPDPNYTDTLTGPSHNIPLPTPGGYQFDAHQAGHHSISGHTFSQQADPNIAFAPHQAHHSPTTSISPFSSTHQPDHAQYRNQRSLTDNNLLNPGLSGPAGSRPSSHNAPPNQNVPNQSGVGQGQGQGNSQAGSSFLSGYSAEDNWFMPWICSTPGADGQAPTADNNQIPGASGSGNGGGYPLTGPGTGSTHSSSVILPDNIGRGGGGHWGELDLDLGSGHHARRPPMDDDPDSRLAGGSRRTGTYQTSRMRSQPSSPPLVTGPGGFNADHQAVAGYTQIAKRGSGATSAGATVHTPGTAFPAAQVEDLIRWSTALTFLNLYHEHLYPLLPLCHWPTFSQHLVSRRDRYDETFRIFLMSLIAYAILQLPRSVMPDFIPQEELVKLHRRLHHTSRAMQTRDYEPLELLHISTLYADHIYLGSTGKDNYAKVVLAEAMRLAIALGLHDENVAVQQNLDAIEKETRRRVFWALYGSDRTIAALISCPMLLHDEDIFVSDILQVDDNLITTAGAFQQPPGKTPLLCGFVHVTRIFRLLSQVLRLARSRAHGQPTPEGQVDTSPDPRELIKSLQMLLDDLPAPLRLNAETVDPRDMANIYAFDTCKANILVTQVLVRFAIYQYATLRAAGRPDQCLDELTEDVLKRLHQMSSESLAANGESIRHKVLFIASSLLNKYPAQDSHEHVSDFLRVYNKILTNQINQNNETQEINA